MQSTTTSQLQRKRNSGSQDVPAKRKPSPIRFETKELSKKGSVAIYSPPKDKFSKKLAEGSDFDDYSFKKKRGGKRSGGGKTSWRD